MKKFVRTPAFILLTVTIFVGCNNNRKPGKIYMPDMTYSRAYETYDERDSLKFTTDMNRKGGTMIYYDNHSVDGTVQRGDLFPYTLPNDSNGYKMSAMVQNPITSLTPAELKETGRLYNINCGICHGEKGEGNGPISTGGYIGGVANLTSDAYVKMSEGTMFHSMAYGKNLMGSYASQLSKKQRWMIAKYIRTLQPGGGKPATDSTGAAKVPADTTKTAGVATTASATKTM